MCSISNLTSETSPLVSFLAGTVAAFLAVSTEDSPLVAADLVVGSPLNSFGFKDSWFR